MKRQSKTITADELYCGHFSDMLSELMDQRGITQEALAAATGITQSKVSRYARGVNEPKLADFAAICKFLNVSPESFLGLGATVKPLVTARGIVDRTVEYFGPEEHMSLSALLKILVAALWKVEAKDRPKQIRRWTEIITLMVEKDH